MRISGIPSIVSPKTIVSSFECTAITRTTSIISDKICLLKSFGNIYICQVILFK